MKLPLARPDDETDRSSFRWLIDLDQGCLLSESKVRQMTDGVIVNSVIVKLDRMRWALYFSFLHVYSTSPLLSGVTAADIQDSTGILVVSSVYSTSCKLS